MTPRLRRRPGSLFSAGRAVVYGTTVLLIVAGWIWAYGAYMRHYREMNPEIAWVVPWVHRDLVPLKGVLLWNETVLVAPGTGVVRYPLSAGPVKVARGAVVATVNGVAVRAPSQGIFLAAVDGKEGRWRYPLLWPGQDELPPAPPVRWFRDGQTLKGRAPLGKVVLQPQEIRLLGYLDLVGTIPKGLEDRRLAIRRDPDDTGSMGEVRVYEKLGARSKLYLGLPWITPDLVRSRGIVLQVEAGQMEGVAVPETALTTRQGHRGVFSVRGAQAVFQKVEGKPIGGGRFLVNQGLSLGDAVIVEGAHAREGRVQLW